MKKKLGRFNPLAMDEDISWPSGLPFPRLSNVFDLPDTITARYREENPCAKCGLTSQSMSPFGVSSWWYEKKRLSTKDKALRVLATFVPWYQPPRYKPKKYFSTNIHTPRCADAEHIARRCGRCGYSWAEFPQDYPGPLEQLARALDD